MKSLIGDPYARNAVGDAHRAASTVGDPCLSWSRSSAARPSPIPNACVPSPRTSLRCRRRGDDVVLVVSAMGKETDELLRLAREVSDDRPGRELDMLITAGERKAIALMSMALARRRASSRRASPAPRPASVTDTNHTNAKIVEVRADRIREALDAGQVPVVAGAQGVSTDNDVTFLGRGGSDTTAVALARALDADACELYTDVSGVFTSDPRIVAEARRMHRITFDEMLEMTAAGCPKPAMRSVEYAHRHRVPLHVRSAFTWEPGTWVTEEEPDMEAAVIRAVVHDLSEAKVTVSRRARPTRGRREPVPHAWPTSASTST